MPLVPMRLLLDHAAENDYGLAQDRAYAAKRVDYFEAGTLVVWDVDPLAPEGLHEARDPLRRDRIGGPTSGAARTSPTPGIGGCMRNGGAGWSAPPRGSGTWNSSAAKCSIMRARRASLLRREPMPPM